MLQIIPTQDGSNTIYNSEIGETIIPNMALAGRPTFVITLKNYGTFYMVKEVRIFPNFEKKYIYELWPDQHRP